MSDFPEDPVVSVILCTYSPDMYEHFREAAESVLAQTYDRVELVVVVDGSDEVLERTESDYGGRDDVVLHGNETNVGLLESRNTGVEMASGEVVAFIDDDAVADERWVEELVSTYREHDALAVGGKMVPEWVDSKPAFLPEEFYWLVGVTHRGFPDEPGEVRNTFGSNISFRRDLFRELGGFDSNLVGRKGEKNLQGGETELSARMQAKYGGGVMYSPTAKVAHKVFEWRSAPSWLLNRAFWQGYSKRVMESRVTGAGGEEWAFLHRLIFEFVPGRVKQLFRRPSSSELFQLATLFVLTGSVGLGYLYGAVHWRGTER